MSDNHDKIVNAMAQLPEDMTADEFEALVCAIVNMHVADEDIPDFFEYMANKIRMLWKLDMLRAEGGPKH